jgi:hypothetical protein
MTTPLTNGLRRNPIWPFLVSIFLSAFLLFQVQLVLGKYFLPWFGGTPAMWTTCLFFFQSLLVVGYLYAHFLADRIPFHLQGTSHAMVLACALGLTLSLALKWHSPVLPDPSWKPVGSEDPIWRLIVLLSVSAGIPYLSLSATGPLLQSWFAKAHPGISPYRLYGLSNLGSFLALLSYPLAVEPWFTLKVQALLWCAGFCAFVICCGYCALRLGKVTPQSFATIPISPQQESPPLSPTTQSPTIGRSIFWLSLAACGSLLFLATTNQICQNIAVVPLLWILPLSIYLLSMVICFDKPNYYSRAIFHPALVVGLALAVFLLNEGVLTKLALQIVCYSLILFVGCMVCHGELVRSRPPAQHLTLFYLMVATGGAVAGIFVVIAAPRFFNTFLEYQLGLWLTTLLMLVAVIRDWHSWIYVNRFGVLLIGLIAAMLPAGIAVLKHGRIGVDYLFLLLVLVSAVYIVGRRSVVGFAKPKMQAAVLFAGFALALLGAIFLLSSKIQAGGSLFEVRNFYGVLAVKELNARDPEWAANGLSHGIISHGFQFRAASKRRVPTSYYGMDSGVEQAISSLRKTDFGRGYPPQLRFGLIGLGIGTLAAYAQPGDYIRFYEINPDVIQIAKNPDFFTFLRDCPAKLEIVAGDARLSMERELAQGVPSKFDLLVVDAFSGDAPPVHLLTEQAFQVYLSEIAQNGIVAIHITNTYINLRPVVAGIAEAMNLKCRFIQTNGDSRVSIYSDWALLSRRDLPYPEMSKRMPREDRLSAIVWTDDYSNLFRVLR